MHEKRPGHSPDSRHLSSPQRIQDIVKIARSDGGGPIPHRIRFGTAIAMLDGLGIAADTQVSTLLIDQLSKLAKLIAALDLGIKESRAGIFSVVGPSGCVRVVSFGFNRNRSGGYAVARDPSGALIVDLITGAQKIVACGAIEDIGTLVFSPDGSRAFVRIFVNNQSVRSIELLDLTNARLVELPAEKSGGELRKIDSISMPIFMPNGSISVAVNCGRQSAFWVFTGQRVPEWRSSDPVSLRTIQQLADGKRYAICVSSTNVGEHSYMCPVDIASMRCVPRGSENAACSASVLTPSGELYFIVEGWGAGGLALCRIGTEGLDDFVVPSDPRGNRRTKVSCLAIGADRTGFIIFEMTEYNGSTTFGLMHFDGHQVLSIEHPVGFKLDGDWVRIRDVGEPVLVSGITLFPIIWEMSRPGLPSFLQLNGEKLEFSAFSRLEEDVLTLINKDFIGEQQPFGVINMFPVDFVSPDCMPAYSAEQLLSGNVQLGYGLKWQEQRMASTQAPDYWLLLRQSDGATVWGEARDIQTPGALQVFGKTIVVSAETRSGGWMMRSVGEIE